MHIKGHSIQYICVCLCVCVCVCVQLLYPHAYSTVCRLRPVLWDAPDVALHYLNALEPVLNSTLFLYVKIRSRTPTAADQTSRKMSTLGSYEDSNSLWIVLRFDYKEKHECLFCNISTTPIVGSQRGDFRSVSADRLQKDAHISDGGDLFWFRLS